MSGSTSKFGTFGGVFTPAILTILGVIMYLRLPWIVGNAGITGAIGIVLIAHVISVTTGLSVSSMATDKRVKAGGSYYILSRSLGLPIGGSLGLALFIGLSFSVSLYVIGFSESFLGYWGYDVTKDTIRVCGSIVLLAVTTVTFISTALAIRTQYFIMAAILVSLASVLWGSSAPPPEVPVWEPLASGAAPMAVVFGIFFPAVTGFEAGVSMSGDLRDPKRSIPVGTLAAIATGLAVYIALAIFFGYRIPAEELVNNPRVLLDYAYMEELVLPGIWGATISSALGSILGAPRILQACAVDRIGPRFFAKGHGPDNEPRNAILLTFVIAWVGVMVGELDVIARVVTMFFLASYGFLNMAAAIEGWVSPDFRPEFRVPRWVSLLGSVTCFVLMLQLDFVAMVAAGIAMGGVFAVLKRRELTLEGGDTWAGVWANLVRTGLERLQRTEEHERNWRPKIIGFSGGAGLALGEQLAAGRGVLTTFDDGEHGNYRGLPPAGPKRWAAMAQVCRFHGLPGMEPNTVLVDAREAIRAPGPFLKFLTEVDDLDFNVLVYRSAGGAPAGRRIDLWSRGNGPNLALQLALVRMLTTVVPWRSSLIRFLVVVDDPGHRRVVEHGLAKWLADARVQATVKVLLSGASPGSVFRAHSGDADLTVLGLSGGTDPDQWLERTTGLVEGLGDVLLLRASSTFSDPLPGLFDMVSAIPDTSATLGDLTLDMPPDPALRAAPTALLHQLTDAMVALADDLHRPIMGQLVARFDKLETRINRALQQLHRSAGMEPAKQRRVWDRVRLGLLSTLADLLDEYADRGFASTDRVAAAVTGVDASCVTSTTLSPDLVDVTMAQPPRAGMPTGSLWQRTRLHRRVRFRNHVAAVLSTRLPQGIDASVERLRSARFHGLAELDSLVGFLVAELAKLGPDSSVEELEELMKEAGLRSTMWRSARVQAMESEINGLRALARSFTQEIADKLVGGHRGWRLQGTAKVTSFLRGGDDDADNYGAVLDQQQLALGRTRVEIWSRKAELRLGTAVDEILLGMVHQTETGLLGDLDGLEEALKAAIGSGDELQWEPGAKRATVDVPAFQTALAAAVDDAVGDLPERVRVVDDASFSLLESGSTDDVGVRDVALKQMIDFVFESELLGGVSLVADAHSRAVIRAEEVIRDVAHLTAQAPREEGEISLESGDVLEASLQQVVSVREVLQGSLQGLSEAVAQRRKAIHEAVDVSALVSDSTTLSRFIRTRERNRWLSGFTGPFTRIRARGLDAVVRLIYRYDRGVSAALSTDTDVVTSPAQATVRWRSDVALSPTVSTDLPLFYRRLFMDGASSGPAYWVVSQEVELQEARRAIAAYESGLRGAIAVIGAPGSGVSVIIERVLDETRGKRAVFSVKPPAVAVDDPVVLDAAIVAATNTTFGDVHDALRALPVGSVVVLRDLNLWWLRHPAGVKAIERLQELIEVHSGHVMFLIGSGDLSLGLLNRVGLLDTQTIAVIRVRPLTARGLRETIMSRQAASGLELWLDNRGSKPSELQLARLFTGLLDQGGGYLGPAMAAWIANLTECHPDGVVIGSVHSQPPPVGLFERLPSEWIAALIALSLHKRLSDRGLGLASGASHPELLASSLVRAGLAVRRGDGLELDPWTKSPILRWLREEGVVR